MLTEEYLKNLNEIEIKALAFDTISLLKLELTFDPTVYVIFSSLKRDFAES